MNPIDQINTITAQNADQDALRQAPQNAMYGAGHITPQPTSQPPQPQAAPVPPPYQAYPAYQPYPAQPSGPMPGAPIPGMPVHAQTAQVQPACPQYPYPAYQYPQYPQYPQPGYAAPSFAIRVKDPRKTGGRRTFSMMALLLVAQIGLSFVLQLALIMGLAAAGYNIYFDNLGLVYISAGLSPICTGLPFLIYMMVGKRDWNQYLRFERTGFFTGLLCVLAGTGICIAGNYPAYFIQDILERMGADLETPSILGQGSSWESFIVELLGVAVLVPMVEEFAFRGVLLSALRKYGTGFAIVGSAVIFGFAHIQLSSVVFAFIAGLVMGWVYVRTNNLWLTILIHALNNGMAVIGSYAGLFTGSLDESQFLQELLSIIPLGVGLLAGLLLLIFHRRLLKKRPAPIAVQPPMPGQPVQMAANGGAVLRPLSFGEAAGCIFKSPMFWAVLAMVLVETAITFL